MDILSTQSSKDYELLDSGDGEKLERYGKYIFRRPDPQALWDKKLSLDKWGRTDASFRRDGQKGDWDLKPGLPERWDIDFGGLRFWIHPSSFKHTGLFPEQQPNWDWMRDLIQNEKREIQVLNLLGMF